MSKGGSSEANGADAAGFFPVSTGSGFEAITEYSLLSSRGLVSASAWNCRCGCSSAASPAEISNGGVLCEQVTELMSVEEVFWVARTGREGVLSGVLEVF